MPDKSVSYALMQALYAAIGGDNGAFEQLMTDDDALKTGIGGALADSRPAPILQTLAAVPAFQALSPHPLPCWRQNGVCTLRNSTWLVDNTAAYTIEAGAAFATGANLKANTSYSVVIVQGDGSANENTLAVDGTGKSLSFTAEQAVEAASFAVFVCEEALN